MLTARPTLVSGAVVTVTASTGVAVADAAAAPHLLLARGDAARYQVKRRGGDAAGRRRGGQRRPRPGFRGRSVR